MPFIIGLTGGIATGKSTVSDILSAQGAHIIDADAIARTVVSPGSLSHRLIVRRFGRHLLLPPDGRLDRPALARLIFSDASARRALNIRTHPFVIAAILQRLFVAVFVHMHSVVVLDVPLLFETGYLTRVCTHTIAVTLSDTSLQMSRLLARNDKGGGGAGNRSRKEEEEEARRRIEAQMPMSEKERRAMFVIDNSGSREDLRAQTILLMESSLCPSIAHTIAFRALVVSVALQIARIMFIRVVS